MGNEKDLEGERAGQSSKADANHLSRLAHWQGCEDLRNQWSEIAEPIGPASHHQDRDLELGEVLLKRQISIHSQEHVELPLGERQESAVFDGRPSHLRDGLNSMPGKFACQAPIHALVEERTFTSGSGQHPLLGFFEEGDDLLALDGGETIEEFVNRVPRLNVIKQRLDGHSRAGEHRRPAHHVPR